MEHGKSGGGSDASVTLASVPSTGKHVLRVWTESYRLSTRLSSLPATSQLSFDSRSTPPVPELPAAFLGRPGLLSQLKAVILSVNGESRATLTSEKAKQRSEIHGMGGVGKSILAAALVNDREVRASFDKVLWVSVGQTPDVRQLLVSAQNGFEIPR